MKNISNEEKKTRNWNIQPREYGADSFAVTVQSMFFCSNGRIILEDHVIGKTYNKYNIRDFFTFTTNKKKNIVFIYYI